MAMAAAARAAFREGVRDMLPAMPALIAWALVTGIAMAKSPLTLVQCAGLGLIAFAGAAQLAALPLLVAGAPVVVSVLSALMVNLRFVIYSAALAPSFRALPLRERLALGYLVSDMGFVMYMRRETELRDWPARGWYFAGLGLGVFFAWHVASLAGLFAGSVIPAAWGLDFAGALALLALLVPMLASRPALAGSLVSAALSVALAGLPFSLGLVVAILAGIAVAVVAESRGKARR